MRDEVTNSQNKVGGSDNTGEAQGGAFYGAEEAQGCQSKAAQGGQPSTEEDVGVCQAA